MARGRRLGNPGFGQSVASDWLTGETSPNVVFQEGKWWTGYHYDHWSRDRVSDRRRIQRNRAARTFLGSQPNEWE